MNFRSQLVWIQLVLCVAFLNVVALAGAADAPTPDATVTVAADPPKSDPGSSGSGSDNGVDPNDLNSTPGSKTLDNAPRTPTREDPCADEVAAMRAFLIHADSILRPLRLELAILQLKGLSDLALKFEQDVYRNNVKSTYESEQYKALYESLMDCLDENWFERKL